MAAVAQLPVWTQQPPYPVDINWSHDLAATLLYDFDPATCSDRTRTWPTTNVGTTLANVPGGLDAKCVAASTQYVELGPTPYLNFGDGDFALQFRFTIGTIGATAQILLGKQESAAAGDAQLSIGLSAAGALLFSWIDASGNQTSFASATGLVSSGGNYDWIIQRRGSSAECWLNGALQTMTLTSSFFSTMASTAIPTKLGGRTYLSRYYDGTIEIARVWRGALAPSQALALYETPWQIYQAPGMVEGLNLIAGGAAALAGAAIANAQAAAALSTSIQLAGAAVVVASAAGSLSTQIPLAGAAVSVAAAAGGLTAQITLSGAAVAQALAAAGLTTAIPLAGAAGGQASATGALTTGGSGLAGDAVARAAAAGALTAQITLTGSAAAIATATGSLNGTPAALAGAATAQASATGAITASIRLTADALAQAAATGSLTVSIRLSGAAAAQASASGNLSIGAVADLDTRFVVSRQTRNWVASRVARNWTVPA